jgi:hypothetical protein
MFQGIEDMKKLARHNRGSDQLQNLSDILELFCTGA